MQNSHLYESIGGAEAVRSIVDLFIDEIENRPGVDHLRDLYKNVDMTVYRERLFEFLCGWLGGPALYTQRHGIPMLRENHRSIPINDSAADEWMTCMKAALDKAVYDHSVHLKIEGALMRMAESLKNS